MATNQLTLDTQQNDNNNSLLNVIQEDAKSSSSAARSGGGKSQKNADALKQQLNTELPPEEGHLYLTEMIGLQDSPAMFVKHVLLSIFLNLFYVLWWAWWPAHWYKFRYKYIEDGTLDQADYILVTDKKQNQTLCPVEPVRPIAQYEIELGVTDNTDFYQSDFHMDKMFMFRNRRYIYNPTTDVYELLHCPKYIDPQTLTTRALKGQTQQDFVDNATLYGRNVLEIPCPSIPSMFLYEFLQPFFCFQMYSVIVWTLEEYYTFSPIIFAMAIFSVCVTVWETKSAMTRLQGLAKHHDTIDVIRDGKRFEINANELAVGDVCILKPGRVCCDMMILKGSAVVNEAMLTGESIPVRKVPENFSLASRRVNITNDRNSIYGGTTILQLKPEVKDDFSNDNNGSTQDIDPYQDEVLAMVTKGGYYTINGNLISSILYPDEQVFEFTRQTYQYMAMLGAMASIGLAWTFWRYVIDHAPPYTMALRAMDLLTIVVPPSLPLAMATAISFSLNNLKSKKLFCINGTIIPVAGKVKLCAYDKTGTLTSESLAVRGVFSHLSSLSHKIQEEQSPNKNADNQTNDYLQREMSRVQSTLEHHATNNQGADDDEEEDVLDIPEPTPMNPEIVAAHCLPLVVREAIACCHSLAIDDTGLTNPIGNDHSINMDDVSGNIGNNNTNNALVTSQNGTVANLDAFDRREAERKAFVSRVVGDPLEVAALDAVNATFVENPAPGVLFGVKMLPYKSHAAQQHDITCGNNNNGGAAAVDVNGAELVANIKPCNCYNAQANAIVTKDDVVDQTWMVLRLYAFDASLQRMSVLALHVPTHELYVFTKGAPEVLFDLSKECFDNSQELINSYVTGGDGDVSQYGYKKMKIGLESKNLSKRDAEIYNSLTTPEAKEQFLLMAEHKRKVDEYSRCGYRVLGLAQRKITFEELIDETKRKPENTLPNPTLPQYNTMKDLTITEIVQTLNSIYNIFDLPDVRISCEQKLSFLGLLVLENQLKPATKPTIKALSSAGIRCVMITGDNIRTAVAVSKEAGIVLPGTAIFVSEIKLKPEFRKAPNVAELAKEINPSTHEVIWRCSDNPRITLNPDTFEVQCPPGVVPNFFRYELAVSGPALTLLIATENENGGDANKKAAVGELGNSLLAEAPTPVPGTPAYQGPYNNNTPYPLSPTTLDDTSSQYTAPAPSVKSTGTTRSRRNRAANMKDSIAATSSSMSYPNIKNLDQITKVQYILLNSICLARFKPDQKSLAVVEFIKLGFTTFACGDGANDSAMLKSANVAISLSQSEASIAAPFTSQVTDISSTLTLLTEGRSTLTSAFLLFRYMAMYSFVQFFCVVLLYWYSGTLCNNQFLAQDLCSVFPIGVVMSRTHANRNLLLKRPSGNLMSLANILGVIMHFLTNGALQYVLFIATQWTWLSPSYTHPANPDNNCEMLEATSLHYFCMISFFYYAIVFALGPGARPWKAGIWTNYWFIAALILSITTSLLMLFLGPSGTWYVALSTTDYPIDADLKAAVVIWSVVGAVVALVLEDIFIPFVRWLTKCYLKTYRTRTIFGLGDNRIAKGAKPYHAARAKFEKNFSLLVNKA